MIVIKLRKYGQLTQIVVGNETIHSSGLTEIATKKLLDKVFDNLINVHAINGLENVKVEIDK